MSRYCAGNIRIGSDYCSVIEADTYSSDPIVERTKFLSNVKPGDAFLINRMSSYQWSKEWSLYIVTSVKSDSIFTFTPRFQTGVSEDDDPNSEDHVYLLNNIYQGQYNDPGDNSNISSDGRFCLNSEWYTSRDFTCFFDLPEIKKGDRAWAEIYNNALNRIDKLLLLSRRNEVSGFSYYGGFIKTPKGTVVPRPNVISYFTTLDFGGDVCSDAFKAFAQSITSSSNIFMSASSMNSEDLTVSDKSLKTIKRFDHISTAIKFYNQITDSYLKGLDFNVFVIADNDVGYVDLYEAPIDPKELGKDIFFEFKVEMSSDEPFNSSEFISSKLENTATPGTFSDVKIISSKQSLARALKTILAGVVGLTVAEIEIVKFNGISWTRFGLSVNEATYPESSVLKDSFVLTFAATGTERHFVSITDADCNC